MQIKCSKDFVKEVSKNTTKHFVLTWTYLIAGGTCLYKAIQHANLTGRYGVFKDILVDAKEVEDIEDVKE